MNILLVQQEMGRRVRANPVYPRGLVDIASCLPASHRVKIIDPNLSPLSTSFESIEQAIKSFRPDIVGLSIKYIDTTNRLDPYVFYNTVPETIARIKELIPAVNMVVGGAGFSIFSREIMEDIPQIDFGVFLEGEESFRDLVDHLDKPASVPGVYYREKDGVHFSGCRSLPSFSRKADPAKAASLLDPSPYITNDLKIFGIQTKRGCSFHCPYCNYPFLNGDRYRLRDPKDVVDEIQFLCEKYGLKKFSFSDNIFNVPSPHAVSICNEIIDRGLKVEWAAWCDMSSVSDEFFRLSAQAGCRSMEFSPDSSTKEGLNYFGKKMDVTDIEKTIRIAQRHRQMTYAFNFFCSHPAMTLKEAMKSLVWWLFIPFLLWKSGRVSLGWIRIYPNTRIHETVLSEGFPSLKENLLAKTAEEFTKTFYHKKHFWLIDWMFSLILKIAEYIIKPILKIHFRVRRESYPFYYE